MSDSLVGDTRLESEKWTWSQHKAFFLTLYRKTKEKQDYSAIIKYWFKNLNKTNILETYMKIGGQH